MNKKILITGAGGYVGSKMVEFYLKKNYQVFALDRFFFGNTLNGLQKNNKLKILKDDIRYVKGNIFKNIDTIVDLASISNDPSSELIPSITKSINHSGAIRIAKLAKKYKVKKYILASSCSMYGKTKQAIVDENSPLNPASVYAESKIAAEKEIIKLADKNFCVTILRFGTLYGLSKRRMRFDLIINIMTLHAWKNGKIFITGGGYQWRPLIHINDVIKAYNLIVEEKNINKVNKQIFNVGSNKQNFQVFQVANKFRKHFSNLIIEKVPDDPDKRSYRVDFDKINNILGFKTEKTIDDGIKEIVQALENGEIHDNTKTKTVEHYKYLINANELLNSIKLNNKLF